MFSVLLVRKGSKVCGHVVVCVGLSTVCESKSVLMKLASFCAGNDEVGGVSIGRVEGGDSSQCRISLNRATFTGVC